MGGRIAAELAFVVGDSDHLAILYDHRPDRDVVVLERSLCLPQRQPHEVLVSGEEALGHRVVENVKTRI